MLTSLMSLFDPSYLSFFPLKWVVVLLALVFLNFTFYPLVSGLVVFFKLVMVQVSYIFSEGVKSPKFYLLILVSLFFNILFNSELGMVPFVFTSTSHLLFNLSLSLPLWLGGVMLLSSDGFFSHLVPKGSPLVLSPFLVLIELISLMVRPFSLSVRLMSNVMAGHMILCLIESINLSVFSFPVLVVSVFFMMFELVVALVQAFVFSSLLGMYWKESS